MTIDCGQCIDATFTELALRSTYVADHDGRNIIDFLDRLRVIYYESDVGGLSHKPYKTAVAVESLYNYTNLKPNKPHRFKEELKVKDKSNLAII